MPFNATKTLPDRPPDVQIFFHGLLMLCPSETSNQCTVGVHRLSVDHKLSISVREKGGDPPDVPLLRLAGPLDSKGLTIAIESEGLSASRGVRAFLPTNSFQNDNPTTDPKDFRFAIDLEELDATQPPVKMKLKKSGISPSITVKDGIFFSAQLTDPEKIKVTLTSPEGTEGNLHRIARLIGTNIYLEDGEGLALQWFADGDDQSLVLPKSKDGSRSHVIYIDNSPSLMPTGKPTHSEFEEYFKVVDEPNRVFQLDFDLTGDQPQGSDAAPCMVVKVGSGGGVGGGGG